MFEKLKANILFHQLLKRPDIEKAYKMVGPEDSWYDTISTVHNSLAQIRKMPHEQLQIVSHDCLKLQGLYYPGSSDRTVIWVHGYTSHAERESAFPGLFYHSLGFNVLIPYLRAHGPSEGKFIALGALEYREIMGWVELMNSKHPHGQILIHGLSMGGGIALDLACQDMQNVKGLVCDAPSHKVDSIFYHVAGSVFKKEREQVFAACCARFKKEFGVEAGEFDRVKNIAQGRYPLLLSAGSEEHMEEILSAIRERNPKETTVLILPGCNHGNGMYKQTELYQSAIRQFITQNFT